MRTNRARRVLLSASVAALASCGISFVVAAEAVSTAPEQVSVTPAEPTSLVVAPDGTLYLVDEGRQEILRRLPDGKYETVAGTRTAGLTGDGGPAIHAEVDDPGSLLFAPNGDLYFVQAGRVLDAGGQNQPGFATSAIREIAPGGVVTTVAGRDPNCAISGASTRSMPAQAAALEWPEITLGPKGNLVIETTACPGQFGSLVFPEALDLGPLLTVTSAGRLVKTSIPMSSAPSAWPGCGGFGAEGPGFVAFPCLSGGGRPPGLLVVRSDGTTTMYPRTGAESGSAPVVASGGEVIAVHNGGIVRVEADRLQVLASERQLWDHFSNAEAGDMSYVVDLALDPRGDIYLSTDTMLGCQGCAPGIFELHPNGRVQELWNARQIRLCY